VNYAGSAQLDVLARADVTVAYCPRASAYFGHDGHLYQEMIRRGVRVALGTDSIVCLDTPNRISTLDEMRLLSRRDGTDADLLLRMATMNGAAGLGFDAHLVSFHPTPMERSRSIGGFIALPTDLRSAHDALAVALSSDEPFEAVMFAPSEDS
jgi:hypothetical protein